MPWVDGIRGKVFLKDKSDDLHNCHRSCEDQISSWNPAGRGICKVQCNEDFSNEEQCNKICTRDSLNKNCSDQCMSQMSEKSHEHTCDDDKCLVDSVEGKCG